MEISTTSLLPYILDLLGRKPDLCSTTDELCNRVRDAVMEEVIRPFGSVQSAVEFSIDLGINIGLLSLDNNRVRLPFSLNPSTSALRESSLSAENCRNVIKDLTETIKIGKTKAKKAQTSDKLRGPLGGRVKKRASTTVKRRSVRPQKH